MNISRRKMLALGAGVAFAGGAAAPAIAADDWPKKNIRFITPYPPGGSSDVITRFVAEGIAKEAGVSVVVENKPGAAGTLGTSYVAKQKPDGYTFLVGPMAVIAVAPWLMDLTYKPDDFMPVAKLSSSYGLISANNNTPFNDYKEFVESAKEKPGKYTAGTNGVGSIVHLTAVGLQRAAGVDVLIVPYKGASETMTDLLGGRIDVMYDPASAPQVQAGKLKALATTAKIRNPEFPDLPTLKEQGFKTPFSGSWFGIFAPNGTPEEVVEKMAGYAKVVVESDDAKQKLQLRAMYPNFEDSRDFSATVRNDTEVLRQLIEKEGLRQ